MFLDFNLFMINLRSIESIKKHHNFTLELASIPAVEWLKPKQIENYENARDQTVKKLEVIDSNIELMLGKLKDENIKLAIERTFYLDEEISSVKELKFRSYLPQGKVQLQRDLIDMLTSIAKGEKPVEDIKHEAGSIKLQAEWEVNPPIGTITINDEKTDLRLHDSLELYSSYLNSCEHEFYKQMLAAKLGSIIHEYHMVLFYEEANGKKPKSKLIEEGDYILNYNRLGGLTDRIYYNRGRDFLTECKKCWDFLDSNEYSKAYLLKWEDVHPTVKT